MTQTVIEPTPAFVLDEETRIAVERLVEADDPVDNPFSEVQQHLLFDAIKSSYVPPANPSRPGEKRKFWGGRERRHLPEQVQFPGSRHVHLAGCRAARQLDVVPGLLLNSQRADAEAARADTAETRAAKAEARAAAAVASAAALRAMLLEHGIDPGPV